MNFFLSVFVSRCVMYTHYFSLDRLFESNCKHHEWYVIPKYLSVHFLRTMAVSHITRKLLANLRNVTSIQWSYLIYSLYYPNSLSCLINVPYSYVWFFFFFWDKDSHIAFGQHVSLVSFWIRRVHFFVVGLLWHWHCIRANTSHLFWRIVVLKVWPSTSPISIPWCISQGSLEKNTCYFGFLFYPSHVIGLVHICVSLKGMGKIL